MAGEWVVEGGGGGRGESGLHSSNGMREPLSNRCRGGARSPRWLLRTLMSFSLDPLPPLLLHRPPSPSGQPPTRRRPSRRPPPPSTRRAAPRHAARHPPLCRRRCRRRRSFSLPHPYSAASHGGRRPSLARCFPFVLSDTEREAAMTRVNLPQTPDRYRRTSASLFHSISLSFSTLLRRTADNCHPPVTLLNQPPFPLYHLPVAAAHPATNLLRMLALYARLALNV